MAAVSTFVHDLSAPPGLAIDCEGSLFVADTDNHCIRKVTPAGEVTTLAGSGNEGSTDGVGAAASFNYPYGLAIDGEGSLFVADTCNNCIRKVTAGLAPPLCLQPQQVSSTFANDMGALLTDESLMDVTFEVSGEQVRAHRVMLVSRSRHAAPGPFLALSYHGSPF